MIFVVFLSIYGFLMLLKILMTGLLECSGTIRNVECLMIFIWVLKVFIRRISGEVQVKSLRDCASHRFR